jgi:phosphoribosylformimino-5-aminoimidazole carboxamide ribotide isomerase
MKIIPAIDLIDGKTVRLRQGEYGQKMVYDISPVDAAKKWAEMGAELIHVVDLDGAREGRPVNLDIVGQIVKAVDIPVETGGGYRTREHVISAIEKGVKRVVLGSRIFRDISFARDIQQEMKEQIRFSLDVKNLRPSVDGWKNTVDIDISTIMDWFADFGVREMIYTDIKNDGMLAGPDIAGLENILACAGGMKVISAGGVKTAEHIRQLKRLEPKGLSGVIIGRALYEGTISLKEAMDAGKTNNTMP